MRELVSLEAELRSCLAQGRAMTDPAVMALCENLLALAPEHIEALHYLALGLDLSGRPAAAERCFQRLSALPIADPQIYLNWALFLKAQGRSSEAADRLEAALRLQAGWMPAMAELIGLLQAQQRHEQALNRVLLELDASPQDPAGLYRLAARCASALARPHQAVTLLLRVLELAPTASDYDGLAQLYQQLGETDQALWAFEQALALAPHQALIWLHQAQFYRALGRSEFAILAYHRACLEQPGYQEAIYQLGSYLIALGRETELQAWLAHIDAGAAGKALLAQSCQAKGQAAQAVSLLREAAALAPGDLVIRVNLAAALLDRGKARILPQAQAREALQILQDVLRQAPHLLQAHYNLGMALNALGRFEEALAAYRQALRLNPGDADSWYNAALCLRELARMPESLDACRRVLALKPERRNARLVLGEILLASGELAAGFEAYEARHEPDLAEAYGGVRALWQGQDLAGRTLLVLHEQCFGDVLMFVRYLSLIKQRYPHSQLILQTPALLERLAATVPGVDQVLRLAPGVLPAYDYFIPLASLPRVCLRFAPIPAQLPYFGAGSVRAGTGGPLARPLRVGLVWASGPEGATYAKRTLFHGELAELLDLPGVEWFSLQKDPDPLTWQKLRQRAPIEDLSAGMGDFFDTAQLMRGIDLLISVDTACVHLAGGLGLPVWTLLPFMPEWRWMLGRSDSYWYPGMRLFRQARPGEWIPVIHAVKSALSELLARKQLPATPGLAAKPGE